MSFVEGQSSFGSFDGSVFRFIPEKEFARQRLEVDGDDIVKDFSRQSAASGVSYGSIRQPLNGQRLMFRIHREKNEPIFNLMGSYLKIGLAFYQYTPAHDEEPEAITQSVWAPDLYALPLCINEMRIIINDSQLELYRANNLEMYAQFVHNLIHTYSADRYLNHPSLFGPPDTITDPMQGDRTPDPAYGAASGHSLRLARWCTGLIAGSEPTKVHQMPLYFGDLFRLSYAPENIFDIKIELLFENQPLGMLQSGDALANNAVCRTAIINCELMYETILPKIFREIGSEVVGQMEQRVYRRVVTKSQPEVVLHNIPNLTSLMIFRPTALGSDNVATAMRMLQAADTWRTYASYGNFIMFDQGELPTGVNTVATTLTRSDDYIPGIALNEWAKPISAFSITYGSNELPQSTASAMFLRGEPTYADFYRLYKEACAKFGTELPCALSAAYFEQKIPFISLSINVPFDYPTRTMSADLTLKFKLPDAARDVPIIIVTNCLSAIELSSSGSVRRYT